MVPGPDWWRKVVWMMVGTAVLVAGLLLALWFVIDIGTEGPGPPVKSTYDGMIGVALLGCLVAVVATFVAWVGGWPDTVLWVAVVGFSSAAVLSFEARLLWMTWVPWYQTIHFPTTISLALALLCVGLALAAHWRRPP